MMDANDVDVLMCTRQGNARYIVGHRPLWRAVITTWAPMCTFVRATRGIHLLAATWDDGIPADIPHEHLNALTWNASNTVNAIRNIAGLADAERIAVDGMQPGLAKLLAMLTPSAELVDGEALMGPVRAVKLPAEIECLRTAIAMAEGALTTVAHELRPGITELALKGSFRHAVCSYGINHPTYEGSFCSTPQRRRRRSATATAHPDCPPVGRRRARRDARECALRGLRRRRGPNPTMFRAVGFDQPAAQRALANRFVAAHDAVVDGVHSGSAPERPRRRVDAVR